MLKVSSLTKKYGAVTALSGVSFEIEKGMVYGLLGPNGAGKSTAMNIIAGVISGQGEVSVDGINAFEDPRGAKAKIGYLPENPPVYGELTVKEYLTFVAKAKGMGGQRGEAEAERVMNLVGLAENGNRLIRNLSKGYVQRVGIAAAITARPEYIILDEPTVGLDPIEIRSIHKLIRDLAGEHTVILSSHILAQVQQVCDSLIIISEGRIVAAGDRESVVRSLEGENRVELTLRGGVSAADFKDVEGVRSVKVEGAGVYNNFTFTVDDAQTCERISLRAVERGGIICRLYMHEPTLEDAFVRIIMSEGEK